MLKMLLGCLLSIVFEDSPKNPVQKYQKLAQKSDSNFLYMQLSA